MDKAPASRIGAYEVLGSLGAGGMGEVYRARDPRLDREVAIKILPPVVADDPDRRSRFEREARALASLNHPNIAHIYGVEDAGGAMAIVMELVEGEDLATRIARGALTWREAAPIARQLADGLDAAHERGIVHRDFKPANIRITPNETVKVLDFGLAKAVAGSDILQQDPGLSPTFTSPSTHLGAIVGTAAYMAPEQAKGKAVDKRADIWAFGCVVYEMLTGRSPFAADTAVESLGLIVTKDPDWKLLPPSTPPAVVELLQRCLVKDPKQRLRDIGDAGYIIANPDARAATAASPPVRASRALYVAAPAGLLLAIAAGAVAWSLKPSAPVPLRRLELPAAMAGSNPVAIAPDGTRVGYFADGRLFVRDLRDATVTDLGIVPPATEHIVWSPDSLNLLYAAEGTVRKVPAGGGPLFTVCKIPGSGRVMGLVWQRDGTIVLSVWRGNLYKVSSAGGQPEMLVEIDPEKEVDFHEIGAGPRGRLFASVHLREKDALRTDILDGRTRTPFATDPALRDFQFVEPGYVLVRRAGENQGLWALRWRDGPADFANAVLIEAGATGYSVSSEGTLIARSDAPPAATLAWVSRSGATTSTTSVPGGPVTDILPFFSVSPGGDRAVFVAGQRPQANIIIRDLGTGADTRLTMDGGGQVGSGADTFLMYPSWFPSGDRVLYTFGAVEAQQLVAHRADGGAGRVPIVKGMMGRVSPDGKWFVWLADDRGEGRLRFAPFDGKTVTLPARSFEGLDKVDIRSFDISPDGNRLLAFMVRESTGQGNVHLIEFPSGSARWQVTTAGGTNPRFSGDGRELYYFTGTRQSSGRREGLVMVVPVSTEPAVKLGVPRTFLSGEAAPLGFDVARDGRLLVARLAPSSGDQPTRATLVQNWPALLDRR